VLRDGYYSAEARDYDRDGWKDYLTIYVNNGQITIAEYDSRNLSGFRRSWDLDHVLEWSRRHGVRPGSVMISYQNSLLTLQDPSRVQPIPGGRNMYLSFTSLAAAAIEQSRNGERQVAYVALPEREYPDEL
jgi:major membrane immunogen (membrane-anchored lipoprotein)